MKIETVKGICDHLVQTHPYCDVYHKAGHAIGVYLNGNVYHFHPGTFQPRRTAVKSENSTAEWKRSPEAFEVEIVNLLLGPIAQAKYVASCDNEIFNSKLIDFNALHHYSGTRDLRRVNEYLQYLSPSITERNKLKTKLFVRAFEFINDRDHWQAITRLAEYMIEYNKNTIEDQEVFSVLTNKENEQMDEYGERWRLHA